MHSDYQQKLRRRCAAKKKKKKKKKKKALGHMNGEVTNVDSCSKLNHITTVGVVYLKLCY